MKTILTEFTCKRCGHSWYPRRPKAPKVCPECKHQKWAVSPNRGVGSSIANAERKSA